MPQARNAAWHEAEQSIPPCGLFPPQIGVPKNHIRPRRRIAKVVRSGARCLGRVYSERGFAQNRAFCLGHGQDTAAKAERTDMGDFQVAGA